MESGERYDAAIIPFWEMIDAHYIGFVKMQLQMKMLHLASLQMKGNMDVNY